MPNAINGPIPTTVEATKGNVATINGLTNPEIDGADEPRVGSSTSLHSSAANELVAPVATAVLVNIRGVELVSTFEAVSRKAQICQESRHGLRQLLDIC